MIPSTHVPRFHPTQAPSEMPIMKEMMVAVPTSSSVQGSALPMSSTTGAGYFVTDIPRSPRKRFPMYCRYWSNNGASDSPKRSAIDFSIAGEICPPLRRSLARKMSAAFPGISRGRKKFRETAAHTVIA